MSDMKDNDPYRSEVDYSAMESVPLIEQQQQPPAVIGCAVTTTRCTDFPGHRRTVLQPPGPPPNTAFVKTGGNALQAVPRMVLEQKQQRERLVAVTVPENVSPGSMIYVQHGPHHEYLLQATIPPGALPGHTFFVQVPDAFQVDPCNIVTATAEAVSSPSGGTASSPSAADGTVVVAGRDAAGELFLVQEQSKDQVHNV